MEPTHRWIEHTAELQLELHARSEAAIFRQAVLALHELLEEHELAETEGLVPDEARDLVVGEDSVTAVVVGRTSEPRHLVKAVTYHNLELHRDRDGWRGNVVLDV